MKLFGGGTSPYVRKCRVTALELGMANRVEFAAIAGASEELKAINPIVKIPVLELDNGEHLFDSRMIMRYLNEQAGGTLYPAGDWAMVRRESEAEGLIDAALLLRAEFASRPEEKRWDGWIETQSAKINNVLDVLEEEADALSRLDAASIAAGCGLGYLDFRFADWGWREGRPAIAKWFKECNAGESMQSTIPG